MSLFFITGLPRNRTAWLATLLSHGERTFCYHDGLQYFPNPKSVVHAMRESNYDIVGDSDSALLLHVAEIIRLVPDAKWVLLYRDPGDSLESYWKHFGNRYPGSPKTYEGVVESFKLADKLFRRAEAMLPKALKVNFEDLDDVNVVQKIWAHCLPGVEFSMDRWRTLDGLRVNVIPEKVKI